MTRRGLFTQLPSSTDELPLTVCDPVGLKACEAMLGYCSGSWSGAARGSAPRSAFPNISSTGYGISVESVPVPLEILIEDPDERPYIWDLED